MELVIDVKGINKSYGNKHVVKDLELQVKKGYIYGFLGPNGSGKTTSLRILCGLLKADSGTGSCLGYPLHDPRIKLHAGYMTQKFSFYEDLSIEENLLFVARLYGLKNPRVIVKNSIKQLGLEGRETQLASQLSGGWKQRLALSACLLHNPKLLLLDEPTAGVDPKARREFWRQIHNLSEQGVTTFVSTHYMDEAEQCSQLAYIAFGKLLCNGTVKDIIDFVGLHTISITGKNPQALIAELEIKPGVEQVVTFGKALHVSSKSKALLESIKKHLSMADGLFIKDLQPKLEDAFINLVGQTDDNFQ